METPGPTEIFLFEGFHLDRRGLFTHDANAALASVEIGSRALDILGVLLERSGDLVSRDEIMAAAWPETVVEDHNLTVQISALRRVLDQDRGQGSCIQTVPGRGYRFVADVKRLDAAGALRGSVTGGTVPLPVGDAQYPAATVPSQSGILSAPAIIQDQGLPETATAPHLSIVVLPFADFSERTDCRHFADRVTDDLTTGLAQFTSMAVTSRTTAETYRNKLIDTKQIGRELGVRYLLEGGVQRFPDHIRVNTRLIDARTDTHLCADQFDRDPADPFAVQDEIGKRTGVRVYQTLLAWEGSQLTEHPDALEYMLRGRAALLFDRDNYTAAIGCFDRALMVDPHCAEAQGWLADALACRALDEMTDTGTADISRAADLAAQAVTASPRSACAHFAQGKVLCAQNRYEEAIPAFETARALNPGWPRVHRSLSDCTLWSGSVVDAIRQLEKAIRINPRDAWVAPWYSQMGRLHLAQSHINDAIAWLEKARRTNPQLPAVHAMLASAYALNGEIEPAAAELAEARGRSRDGRSSNLSRLRRIGYFGVPEIRALFEATFFAGLRKAGMPEE